MGGKSAKEGKTKKHKKPKYTIRVLILGISGSGKSTFAKQMRILTNGGFDEDELRDCKQILQQNILVGMQELVKTAEKLEYPVEGENRKHCRFFTQMTVIETEWSEKIHEKVKQLWTDPAIQRTWKAATNIQLQMSQMDYLMENIDRISREDYVPSNEDILRARQRTTGEHCTNFVIDKVGWDLIDVGGQKPERAKWESIITSKDSVNAIIFFGALDEYNMSSSEEAGKTKMDISIEVFHDLLASEAVKGRPQMGLILFLNKTDLFTCKLSREEDKNQFQNLFPDWKGSQESAYEVVREKFTQGYEDYGIRTHAICALNTALMGTLFKEVRQQIFEARLLHSGLRV